MADLKIIIKKSSSNAGLETIANVETELLFLNIPSNKVLAAKLFLSGIDKDNQTSSDTVDERNGNTTDSLVLPKEAIT